MEACGIEAWAAFLPRVTRAPHRSGYLAAAAMFTPSPRSVALLTIAPTLSRAASLIDKQECIKAELAGDPKAPVCTGIPRSADPVKRAADPTFSESFKKVLRANMDCHLTHFHLID